MKPTAFAAVLLRAAIPSVSCLAICLAGASVSFAESEEPKADLSVDDEIVVSATLVPADASQVGSSVTVIDAADLERHRHATVAEALRLVPGLELSRVGGPGQVTSAFVRGGSSAQTLVLLDGVRVNAATTGAFDLAGLSTVGVERIEILRGAQSPLYGSEAAAGVISIITRRAPGAAVSALAEAGQGDHGRLRVVANGGRSSGAASRDAASSWIRRDPSAGATWRLGGEWLETASTSAADPRAGNDEEDALEAATFDASASWSSATGRLVAITARHLDQALDVDGFAFGVGPVDDLDATNDRVTRQVALRGSTPFGAGAARDHLASVRLGWFDEELEGRDPGNPFGAFVVENQRLEFGGRVDLALGLGSARGRGDEPRHLISVGADLEQREGASVGSYLEERDVLAVFVEDRWQIGRRATVTAGARYDDHDTFGSETTGRVAISVGLGESARSSYRLHGSWGTGFRAPSFADLFFPGFGNPDLSPETSRTLDLGVEARFGALQLDLTAFRADFDDLIAFDFSTFLPQNIASAETEGVELTAAWRSEQWSVRASHTWLDTLDEGTGQSLARRPDARTTLDLGFAPGERWRFGLAAIAVGDRIDSDGSDLETYERVDLSAHTRVGERFEPYVRVLNVFDDDSSEVGGYGTQGLTAIAGLAARW